MKIFSKRLYGAVSILSIVATVLLPASLNAQTRSLSMFNRDIDRDGDSFTSAQGDCNDSNPYIFPTAPELYNTTDDNCNGVNNEDGKYKPFTSRQTNITVSGNHGTIQLLPDMNNNSTADMAVIEEGRMYLVDGQDLTKTTTPSVVAFSEIINNINFTQVSSVLAMDVNKDGNTDMIVGVRDAYEGSGAVYMMYGPIRGMENLSSANAEFVGMQFAQLGATMANGGDVNADGYEDVLIGSPSLGGHWYDPGDGGEMHWIDGPGGVYVVYGETQEISGKALQIDTQADSTITQLGDEILTSMLGIGTAVAGVGDYNADGVDDIAIGAPAMSNDTTYASGLVSVLYGPIVSPLIMMEDIGTALPGQRISAEHYTSDLFGSAIAAGDMNNDSCVDLIVGSPNSNYFSAGAKQSAWYGAAYVIYGCMHANQKMSATQADAKFVAEKEWDSAGSSVSYLGDVDGDGYGDMAVGAMGADYSGRVYVVSGAVKGIHSLSTVTNKFITTKNNTFPGVNGMSVVSDVNADGYMDIPMVYSGDSSDGLVYFGGVQW